MMKKLLYIIGFMMISTIVATPLVALGESHSKAKSYSKEEIPFSSARLFSKLEKEMGLDPNADWTTSFGATEEEDVGQDLYFIILDKLENEPENEAYKNTAGKYGMSQGDLTLLLNNSYAPILDKKPTLTQEEAIAKMAEIQQKYKEEKELLVLRANIEAAVEPSEMFANDDVGDSGFDLINDLRIIEELLFLETDPIDIGGAWPGAAAEAAPVPPAVTTEGVEPGVEEGVPTPGEVVEGVEVVTEPKKPAVPGAVEGFEDAINPNVCFADEQYDEAFEKFEEKKKTDPNYKDKSGLVPPGARPGEEKAALAGEDFFPEIPEPEEPPVKPAPADNWLKDRDCDSIFCLDVNFVKVPAKSAFSDSDNCILCHTEKINDVLKKTISHSLVPSKAPGNLGESAQCKKAMGDAFSDVSMNFYAIAMPVQTPINDDLIFGTNIEEEWYRYCNAHAFFPADSCKRPGEEKQPVSQYETPPSAVGIYAQRAVTMAAEGVSQLKVVKEVSDSVARLETKKAEETAAYGLESNADESIGFYNALQVELNQMNYYFFTIKNILKSLHEKVDNIPGPQACTEIKNKKECE